jgi:hypothetical protein
LRGECLILVEPFFIKEETHCIGLKVNLKFQCHFEQQQHARQ